MFLAAARFALTTVTSLKLKLPHPSSTLLHTSHPCSQQPSLILTNDVYGLSALPAFCPSVQHLILDGSVSSAVLKRFGATVSILKFVAQYTHPATVDMMHELLPLLQDLHICGHMLGGLEVNWCYNLSKLLRVESLTVDGLCISSANMWKRLPPNLHVLSCARFYWAPPDFQCVHQLRILCLTHPAYSLKALAGLLRSAPNLHTICAPPLDINAGFVSGVLLEEATILSIAADLIILNTKQKAGVIAFLYSLFFDDCEDLLKLLQSVPVLSAFKEISLDWVSVHATPEIVKRICMTFPCVTALHMRNSEVLDDGMMVLLLKLRKLESLSIVFCPLVTIQSLTFLLCQLPIKKLHCLECESVSQVQASMLGKMMAALGRQFELLYTKPDSSGSESE